LLNKKIIQHILALFFPHILAKKFYYELNNPKIRKITTTESKIFSKASEKIRKFNHLDINTFHWPGEKGKILIIHGWEGRATNFESIIKELVKEGFDVSIFDAPSHGTSAKSNTTMKDFGEFVQHLLKTTNFDYIITHSFGAVPCSFTLSESQINLKKIVFIAPPDHFTDWINDVSRLIGINQKIIDITLEKFKKDYNMNPYEMSVSKFIKKVKNISGLIIHGEKDKITPLERAINVNKNWQGSNLEIIPDIGHFKILDSKKTISEILKYLKN